MTTKNFKRRIYSVIMALIIAIGMIASPILEKTRFAATTGVQVVAEARRWCGVTKYVWGGNSLTTGADCSGFVCCVFQNCGINLWAWRSDFIGGLSSIGIDAGTDSSNARAGDIVVWSGHVGIAVDNNTVIQCQNSTGATERTFSYMNRYWGNIKKIIRPSAIGSQVPIGCVDICEIKNGSDVHIAGWAFDGDDDTMPVAIHVYVNNNFVTAFIADNDSPDVNNVYAIRGTHRFDTTFKVTDTGNITVDIYAIDLEGITNPLLGQSPDQCTRFNLYVSPVSNGTVCIKNGVYKIKSTNGSGKYVSVATNQRFVGGNVVLYANGKGDQLFTFKRNSDGSYTISNSIGLVLDVRGAAYRGTVQLYTPNLSNAQKWDLVSSDNGTFLLVNRACGLVMDICGNSQDNGTDIGTYEANGTSAQSFRLKRVR